MASTSLKVNVRISGVHETLAAFRNLPDEANNELRDATLKLAQTLSGQIQQSALSEGRQAALMAPTVKAKRDRVPVVTAGGTKRVGRNKKPAFKLLFGSEFGSRRKQFKPHRGRQGYWFFPIVEKEASEIAKTWDGVAQDIIARFSAGG